LKVEKFKQAIISFMEIKNTDNKIKLDYNIVYDNKLVPSDKSYEGFVWSISHENVVLSLGGSQKLAVTQVGNCYVYSFNMNLDAVMLSV